MSINMRLSNRNASVPKKRQSGVGLIEVLIAVLVLAVGLLGFTGLQTQALRMNFDSLQRARASMLAEDLFDRMRANPNQALTTELYLRDSADEKPTAETDCSAAQCTVAEMANWDMRGWMDKLEGVSDAATAAVTRDNRKITIVISLVEQAEGALIGAQLADNEVFDADSLAAQSLNFTFETQL